MADDWKERFEAVAVEFAEFKQTSEELEQGLQAEIEDSSEQIKALDEELKNAQAALHKAKREMEILIQESLSQKAESYKEIDALRLELDKSNHNVSNLSGRTRILEQQNDDLEKANRRMETELADRVERLEIAIEDFMSLEDDMKELQAAASSKTEHFQKEIEKLKAKAQLLEEQARQTVGEPASMQRQISRGNSVHSEGSVAEGLSNDIIEGLICSECFQKFSTIEDLENHFAKVHAPPEDKEWRRMTIFNETMDMGFDEMERLNKQAEGFLFEKMDGKGLFSNWSSKVNWKQKYFKLDKSLHRLDVFLIDPKTGALTSLTRLPLAGALVTSYEAGEQTPHGKGHIFSVKPLRNKEVVLKASNLAIYKCWLAIIREQCKAKLSQHNVMEGWCRLLRRSNSEAEQDHAAVFFFRGVGPAATQLE